jgi:glycerophosphoryl diester phosphodiesterase
MDRTTIALPARGICAHRGAMGTHPQNTLAAFREAARMGAQMIEFDVRKSRDEQLVLYHDLTLKQVTGNDQRPEELTLAELKAIDIGSHQARRFKGEQIPTLEEALAIMPVNVWLLVHLHYGPTDLAQEVAQVVFRCDRQHQSVLGTLPDKIEAARREYPEIKVANLREHPNTPDYVAESIALKVDFARFWSGRWTGTPLAPKLIEEAKAAGMRVIYFEPEHAGDLSALYAMGVDFPVVEDARAMLAAAAGLGMAPVQPVFRD